MPAATTERPAELADLSPEECIELDVRPILKRGDEPFGEIMEAVGRVPAGGALCLRATFRPTPLLGVMRARGFRHWIERGEGDDWIIWFFS